MALPNNPKMKIAVSSEVKAFSVPVVSILGVILVVVFVVFPMWNKVQTSQNELNKSNKQLTSLKAKDTALQNLDTTSLQKDFERAELALPSAKEVPALLVGISRLYQEQGLELTALKITPGNVSTASAIPVPVTPATTAPVVAANKPLSLDFNLVLAGSLEQARGFLMTLEKSLRLMYVKSFSFSSGNSGVTQISLAISAPYLPFPPLPKDFTESLPTLDAGSKKMLLALSQYTPLTTPFTPTATTSLGTTDPFKQGPSKFVVPSPTPPTPVASSSSRLVPQASPSATPSVILLPRQ